MRIIKMMYFILVIIYITHSDVIKLFNGTQIDNIHILDTIECHVTFFMEGFVLSSKNKIDRIKNVNKSDIEFIVFREHFQDTIFYKEFTCNINGIDIIREFRDGI